MNRTISNILEVSASGRQNDSISRQLTAELIGGLTKSQPGVTITHRNLADGVELVDESWIAANFTDETDRTAEQRDRLAVSDALVDELKVADAIVIGAPIYNFGVPAALKAWVDMIARARLTFRYTENGPEGLLQGKKAYVVIASGGVPVDSAVDFATPYLRQALRFIGITDVEVIAADKLNQNAEGSIEAARARIAQLTHSNNTANNRAA
ncbi:MAG: FMN-dependent NADH-azoreductase [Woeseiaceae bacterium]